MRRTLDARQDFGLDELGVFAGHGVVFEAALAALGIAAAVADGDGDHHRDFMFSDQAIERGKEHMVGSIGANDEWSLRAGDVLLRHINRNMASVRRWMAGGDYEAGRIC